MFDGTDIGREPTEDRLRYVVLRFNFSAFDDTLETLQERFDGYCSMIVRDAMERNPDLFPEAAMRRILAPPSIDRRLGELFVYVRAHDIPLYVMIDDVRQLREHDPGAPGPPRRTSRLLMAAASTGSFFATLKAGAGESGGAASSGCSSPASRRSPWTMSRAASTSART